MTPGLSNETLQLKLSVVTSLKFHHSKPLYPVVLALSFILLMGHFNSAYADRRESILSVGMGGHSLKFDNNRFTGAQTHLTFDRGIGRFLWISLDSTVGAAKAIDSSVFFVHPHLNLKYTLDLIKHVPWISVGVAATLGHDTQKSELGLFWFPSLVLSAGLDFLYTSHRQWSLSMRHSQGLENSLTQINISHAWRWGFF